MLFLKCFEFLNGVGGFFDDSNVVLGRICGRCRDAIFGEMLHCLPAETGATVTRTETATVRATAMVPAATIPTAKATAAQQQ